MQLAKQGDNVLFLSLKANGSINKIWDSSLLSWNVNNDQGNSNRPANIGTYEISI